MHFQEDGSTKLVCCECERKVRQTTHSMDGAKVDYYTIDQTVGKDPVVQCVDCREKEGS